MARLHRVGGTIAALFSAYILVLFSVLRVPFADEDTVSQLLPVIPWWLLVSFGAYSLGSLGMGLLRFRECPGAHEDLLAEIQQAKADLRLRGVQID